MTGYVRYVACLRQLDPEDPSQTRSQYYRLPLAETVTLGRDPACEIPLDPLIYRTVSRRHAELRLVSPTPNPLATDAAWQICDLNSANGTFVNGSRLRRCQRLQVGDRIVLGRKGPVFVFEQQPQVADEPVDSVTPISWQVPTPLGEALVPAPAHEAISLTQLFPILSTGRELAHKVYLLPAALTILLVVLLFWAVGQPPVFNLLLAAYLAGAAYYVVYQLCGKHKPWWVIVAVAMLMALILVSPILDLFVGFFRNVLPGHVTSDGASTNILLLLLSMFFGAGLMEEALKAIPVGLAYWLGTRCKEPLRTQIGVWEPLDGILLGAAAAVGFTLLETLGQYVPDVYQSTLAAGEDAAQLAGLQLLIPRVLGSVAGHISYSGYLGYFIGLSVLHRRRRWLILGVGYLSAAGLHTLWNASGMLSPVLLAAVGLVSYAFLGAAILKARELSPTRSQNFATRLR